MTKLMTIDLSDFDNRKEEIAKDLIRIASKDGLFYIINHGIPEQDLQHMFNATHSFFKLPERVKENYYMDRPRNAGWEKISNKLTEIETPKEIMQLSFYNTTDLRPTDSEVPGFNATASTFMDQCDTVSQKLLTCFALGLGFPPDFFTRCHDISQPDCLNSLLCMNHRPESDEGSALGAHRDITTFSLIFQEPEQTMVCNLGNMMMRWSDDRLQTGQPDPSDRFTLEYMNEANRSAIIQGRTKYTQPITAGEFLMMAMERKFDQALKKKQDSLFSSNQTTCLNHLIKSPVLV